MKHEVDLFFDYPSKVADMLLNDEADIGLIPVAILPGMKEYYIITDYCIGAVNPVASVCLFSEVPVHQIKEILLDYQSRTSVTLLKILLNEHWNINPVLINTKEGFEQQVKGSTAALIIGDRALSQLKRTAFVYDLAEGWQQMTGLPFVFATWVANKQLPVETLQSFNKTTGEGLLHLKEIVEENAFKDYDLYTYYTSNIDYHLDDLKRKGMELFLQKINQI